MNRCKKLQLKLPSLDEQKRIAEALRTRCRAALALLDELTQSIFLDMFGDPVVNPKEWPTVRLSELLAIPLRNGLSPSKSGDVVAKVLTLSAVTGREFDETAWKSGTFQTQPPEDQSVNENDFLICRGNGNLSRVGRGFFPTSCRKGGGFGDSRSAYR